MARRVVYLSCPQPDFNQHLEIPNCRVNREWVLNPVNLAGKEKKKPQK